MNDRNQFDQYKQKLLHVWSLFLTACGKLWEQVKAYSKKAAVFLRRSGRKIVQKLAALLLLAKEKADPVIQRAGEWLVSVTERLRNPTEKEAAELSVPEKTEEAPTPEESIMEDGPAETVQETAEEAPKREPAWKSNPRLTKIAAIFAAIGTGAKFAVKWIRKLYKFIMAAPVIWFAVKFAIENMKRLPEEVGLDIQSTGEFARMITRSQAVWWPLGITMFCLLLMFCSKKPVLPWVISIFTLVLPWLIWILNYYA